MNLISSVLSASLSPNAEYDDVGVALRTIVRPWIWKRGNAISKVAAWFTNGFAIDHVYFFNSGRVALLALLHAFDVGKGDEVIVQAFTCAAVPNSVLWAGATPIYSDIDHSYNMDPDDLEKKITKRTKAVVVQHTFGIPADMSRILALTKKHSLVLIEDVAHGLGSTYRGTRLGLLGDAAFFSFGRDKVLSSVWGGAAFVSKNQNTAAERLREYHHKLPMPSMFWIFQQLIHPIVFSVILPFYTLGIGKVLLVVLQKLGLLSLPVDPVEKKGMRPPGFPARYPNALARLLMGQLKKLSRFTAQRKKTTRMYDAGLTKAGVTVIPTASDVSLLRYPLLVNDPKPIMVKARKRQMLLGNWYHNVIDPAGTDFGILGYVSGSCPNAEHVSRHIVNLPTLISEKDVSRILTIFPVK